MPLRGSSHPGHISIHALREESDAIQRSHPFTVEISIHALREESDLEYCGFFVFRLNFNPRSP